MQFFFDLLLCEKNSAKFFGQKRSLKIEKSAKKKLIS